MIAIILLFLWLTYSGMLQSGTALSLYHDKFATNISCMVEKSHKIHFAYFTFVATTKNRRQAGITQKTRPIHTAI